MLQGKAREGCRDLLTPLSYDVLSALCDTVTNRQVPSGTRQGAIRAIMDYTMTPLQLLKRKKVKREYLFQYLRMKETIVPPQAEKKLLIKKILELWGEEPNNLALMEFEEENGGGDDSQGPEIVGSNNHNTITVSKSELSNTHTDSDIKTKAEAQLFAEQFAGWFYQMLNSYGAASSSEFGPQHFYPNCKMKLVLPMTQTEESFSGGDLVCQRHLAFVIEEKIHFNPNPSGVTGMAEPHGLQVVNVRGTVHIHSNVVGIFDQQFGLVRDPQMENNWRVKFTNLAMSSDTIPRALNSTTTHAIAAGP